MQRELARVLDDVGARPTRWQAFPIRTFVPGAPVAAPRALLVGDAAGCDPLMGEGISFALEYGIMAADAIVARARGCGRRVYARAVRDERDRRASSAASSGRRGSSTAGTRRGGSVSRALSRRAQAIGLAWYNGVDGWDERSGWAALRALVRPREHGRAR